MVQVNHDVTFIQLKEGAEHYGIKGFSAYSNDGPRGTEPRSWDGVRHPITGWFGLQENQSRTPSGKGQSPGTPGQSNGNSGTAYFKGPADTTVKVAPELVGGRKVQNPIQIVKTMVKTLGVGQDIGTRKIPKGVQGFYATRAKWLAAGTRYASDPTTLFHETGH